MQGEGWDRGPLPGGCLGTGIRRLPSPGMRSPAFPSCRPGTLLEPKPCRALGQLQGPAGAPVVDRTWQDRTCCQGAVEGRSGTARSASR